MSGRGRGPLWPKLVAGLIAIALLVLALVFMSRLFLGALNLLRTDGGPVQPDPQFAEPVETVEPPASWTEVVEQSLIYPYANAVNGALLHYDWTDLLK